MRISILTLFPQQFSTVFSTSMIHRAQKSGAVNIDYVDIRNFASGAYKSVDDHPYGGGVGMLLRVDVVDRALQSIKGSSTTRHTTRTILLDPQGTPYTQIIARRLATTADHLILICGHYEGVDHRVRKLVDEQISIGDYVLTGGEIPAMVITDSVTRLLGGVLDPHATSAESFSHALLEYPQYTKPRSYKHMPVPKILLSGNHQAIDSWRTTQATVLTRKKRPDLVTEKTDLSFPNR